MFCTDVGGLGEITDSWTATAGSVVLHVEPGEGMDATATVTLTNVEFVADDPENAPYAIDSYVFEDVGVGWLPG
jgi:diaminopimelate decarboxylase